MQLGRLRTQADLREESESDSKGDERGMLLRCDSHVRKSMCCQAGERWKSRCNERGKAWLLRLRSEGGRGGLVVHGAACVRHLRIGGRVVRAAGMAGRAHTVHVNLVCLLGQRRGKAGCRADEERQQAEDRNETRKRVLHAVSVETDSRGNRYTNRYSLAAGAMRTSGKTQPPR